MDFSCFLFYPFVNELTRMFFFFGVFQILAGEILKKKMLSKKLLTPGTIRSKIKGLVGE